MTEELEKIATDEKTLKKICTLTLVKDPVFTKIFNC